MLSLASSQRAPKREGGTAPREEGREDAMVAFSIAPRVAARSGASPNRSRALDRWPTGRHRPRGWTGLSVEEGRGPREGAKTRETAPWGIKRCSLDSTLKALPGDMLATAGHCSAPLRALRSPVVDSTAAVATMSGHQSPSAFRFPCSPPPSRHGRARTSVRIGERTAAPIAPPFTLLGRSENRQIWNLGPRFTSRPRPPPQCQARHHRGGQDELAREFFAQPGGNQAKPRPPQQTGEIIFPFEES